MFVIIEVQKLSDTQIAVPPAIQCAGENEAESEYCRVRSVAAVSSVPVHTVFLLRDDGDQIDYKCYKHEVDA